MTLILSYQGTAEFVLVGDLMLSSENNKKVPDLPALFEGGRDLDNPKLVGLDQKVIIVTDQIAIAWAGVRIIAQSLVRSIYERSHEIQSVEDCFQIIDTSGYSAEELKLVSFIIYLMRFNGDDCNISVGAHHTRVVMLGPKQKVQYAGSGDFHFLDCIEFQYGHMEGEFNEFENMIATWLQRACIAFYEELTLGTPHDFFYGGSFELLVPIYAERKFKKIPYSMFFWRYGADHIQLLDFAYSLQYVDRDLVINRMMRNQIGNMTLKQFHVGSILSNAKDDCLPPATIDNNFSVHFFLPEDLNSDKRKSIIQKGADQNLRPTLVDKHGTLKVKELSNEFLGTLLSFLNA